MRAAPWVLASLSISALGYVYLALALARTHAVRPVRGFAVALLPLAFFTTVLLFRGAFELTSLAPLYTPDTSPYLPVKFE